MFLSVVPPWQIIDHRLLVKQKIKKIDQPNLNLCLVKNPDILAEVATLLHDRTQSQSMLIGFAAETDNLITNARRKLEQKCLDLVVANDVSRKDIGFDQDDNEVALVWEKATEQLNCMSKSQLAVLLVDKIASFFITKEAS